MGLVRLGARLAGFAATLAFVLLAGLGLAGYATATAFDRPSYTFPSRVAARGPIVVAVLGDSLAHGMRASTPASGFVGLLFSRISAERPGSKLVNVSVPGAHTREMPLQLASLRESHVDLVLLVAGGNDVMAATDPVSLARAERSAFDAIARRYPAAAVVFTNVPDVSRRRFTFRPLGRHVFLPAAMRLPLAGIVSYDNALVDRIGSRRKAALIDLQALSRTREGNDPRFISRDGLHPNDAGHLKLAAFAWPVVNQALRSESSP
jgi:lysophospholipase L1-like esterase